MIDGSSDPREDGKNETVTAIGYHTRKKISVENDWKLIWTPTELDPRVWVGPTRALHPEVIEITDESEDWINEHVTSADEGVLSLEPYFESTVRIEIVSWRDPKRELRAPTFTTSPSPA